MPSDGRKPWYRPRNIMLMIVIGVLGLLGVTVIEALTAVPGNAVDYAAKIQELSESAQASSAGKPNAWPTYIDATKRYEKIRDELTKAAGGADNTPADWPKGYGFPFDFSALRDPAAPPMLIESSLDAMQAMKDGGVFDQLAAVAKGERFVAPKFQGNLAEIVLPELGLTRALARMNAGRMFVANRVGDQAERLAAFEQALALARVMLVQPILIDRLVGIAIVSLALGELRSELISNPAGPDELQALLDAIDRQLGPVPPMATVIDGERLFVLDAIQWTHSDNGRGDGTLLFSKLGPLTNGQGAATGAMGMIASHPIANALGLFYPSKATTTAKTNEFFDGAVSLSGLPKGKRDAFPFQLDTFADSLPRGFVVLKLLLPAIDRSIASNDQFLTEVAGVRAMLAVETYRARHGKCPDTLAALVPEILPSLPIDPFSGKPFGYRVLDNPAADPFNRGYLLYSVGLDGVDDQGTPAKKANFEALRKEGKGADYIINTPP